MTDVDVTINGDRHRLAVESRLTLLEVLRESLLLTGAKEGCGIGECGACVVLVDGEPIASCLVLAVDVDGCAVETIEGLAPSGELSEVQQAFVATGALQCGFCTPAMVMTSTALLRNEDRPTAEDVKKALSGVLCRCGTYPKVLEAFDVIGGGTR